MYSTKTPIVLPEQAAALGIPVELPPSPAGRHRARPRALVQGPQAIAIAAALLWVAALVQDFLGVR